ncbi:MAG: DoxX family protein [Planctomycetota bacterium]
MNATTSHHALHTAAAAMTPDRSAARAPRLVWVFQILAAAILGMTLPFKFTAAPETVALFDALGAGAAGRLGTAVLETFAVVMLLTPRLAAIGGALTVGLMSGAIFSHLTVLGIVWDGDASLFTMAVVGLLAGTAVAWLRRRELPIVGPRLR